MIAQETPLVLKKSEMGTKGDGKRAAFSSNVGALDNLKTPSFVANIVQKEVGGWVCVCLGRGRASKRRFCVCVWGGGRGEGVVVRSGGRIKRVNQATTTAPTASTPPKTTLETGKEEEETPTWSVVTFGRDV